MEKGISWTASKSDGSAGQILPQIWRGFDVLPSPAAAQEVRTGGVGGAEGTDSRARKKEMCDVGDSKSKKWLATCF
jgi:hypothetical protein